MRAVVVYESMFGNTHVIADHVAEGLGANFDVAVVPVADATPEALAGIELLVAGGPTHVHGMSGQRSRQAAVDVAKRQPEDVVLDPQSGGPGLKDWIDELNDGGGHLAAAFDTRIAASPVLTGRASKGIARRLRRHGFGLVGKPESFLVDKHNHLLPGEAERATAWGASLAARVPSATTGRPSRT